MTVQADIKSNPDTLTKGVVPYIQVEGAAAAVDFYKRAFAPAKSRAPRRTTVRRS